jgi:type VI secretion system secreted protein VgrG
VTRCRPWELPANATASGILTRSSSGGAANQANMLRFEDRTGAEQILLHAERNLDVEVEADETHTTGGTRTTLIKGHESATYRAARRATSPRAPGRPSPAATPAA